MKSTASLFPELVITEEKPRTVEDGKCTEHVWLKPENDSAPDVIAKCCKCGMSMMRRESCCPFWAPNGIDKEALQRGPNP